MFESPGIQMTVNHHQLDIALALPLKRRLD